MEFIILSDADGKHNKFKIVFDTFLLEDCGIAQL